jgi:citrate synthase
MRGAKEKFMGKSGKPATRICKAEAHRIVIRGRDLATQLMGRTGFVGLFLLQALGRKPAARQIAIVDAVLVTIMEHGLVPSAVVTRLTKYGAPDSYQGAIAAGLLGVGDRYAGTAGLCGELFERLLAVPRKRRAAAAVEEIRRHRAAKRALPGFGHPTHKKADPRVPRLIRIAQQTGVAGRHIEVMRLVEQQLQRELGRKIPVNISAAIAAVLGEAGLPPSMMRGIVLIARCAGLVGHLHEESQRPIAEAMWQAAEQAIAYDGDGSG